MSQHHAPFDVRSGRFRVISAARMAVAAALAAIAAIAAPSAPAQQAGRPITIVVPMTPGTGPDMLARLVADGLKQQFNQAVVVDNRPGASGNIGAAYVARAAPDGHTLMVIPDPPFTANLNLRKDAPYDPTRDFDPIVELAVANLVLVVPASVPATSARAFVEYVKARPGEIDYGSTGIGTPHHLTMELFQQATQTHLRHISFKDSGGGFTAAIIGGHVSAAFIPQHFALKLPQDRVRLLALSAGKRLNALPELPTLGEEGFPGVESAIRFGLLAPAGTAPALVSRYNAAVNEILRRPATLAKLAGLGITPVGGTPEQYTAAIASDLLQWRDVIRKANIPAN